MKKFTYTGGMDHNASIRMGGKITDLRLTKGTDYDLPADDPHIKTLVATGLLVQLTNNLPNK